MPYHSPATVLESVVHLTRNTERDALVKSLLITLRDLLGAERGSIYWVIPSAEGPKLSLALSISRAEGMTEYMELGDIKPIGFDEDPDFSLCIETRNLISRPLPTAGMMRYVHPVFGRDDVVGVLEMIGQEYGDADARLVSGFLEVFRNYVHVLDESERDTLTGLLNRRTFDTNIGRILSESRRLKDSEFPSDDSSPRRREGGSTDSWWLAVLDIDHFKSVNDKFGHIYGDEVLILLSRIMKRAFRINDKLFRFGGEEFVVALEPTDQEGAYQVLERLRQTIESYVFPQVGRVTVSIGYVRVGAQDVPATVVGHADEALYYAKQNGRNQVCSYESLVSQGKITASTLNEDVVLF